MSSNTKAAKTRRTQKNNLIKNAASFATLRSLRYFEIQKVGWALPTMGALLIVVAVGGAHPTLHKGRNDTEDTKR